ncbi:hypothetical protein ACFDTO_23480 [Microbacteriaceae bacterium 4G12]
MSAASSLQEQYNRLKEKNREVIYYLCVHIVAKGATQFIRGETKKLLEQVSLETKTPFHTVRQVYYRYIPHLTLEELAKIIECHEANTTIPAQTEEVVTEQLDSENEQIIEQEEEKEPENWFDSPYFEPKEEKEEKNKKAVLGSFVYLLECHNKMLPIYQNTTYYCELSDVRHFFSISKENKTYKRLLAPYAKGIKLTGYKTVHTITLSHLTTFIKKFIKITQNVLQKEAMQYFLKEERNIYATDEIAATTSVTSPDMEVIQDIPKSDVPKKVADTNIVNPEMKQLIRLLNETVGFLSPAAKDLLENLITQYGYVTTTIGITKAWEQVEQDIALHFMKLVNEQIRGYL